MAVELKPLPPEAAIRFFQSKGLAESFAWQDVWAAEHARAFTVAKAMERTVLEEIRAALELALEEGTTFETFRSGLRPRLEALGWWGRREMTDPLTGESREVQLGSGRRLATIFNMNLRTAYAAGRWERIEASKALLPLLAYRTVGDSRTRPEHRAWDGVCLPVDDPWWSTHYPPCDWGCRCRVVQMDAEMATERGLTPGERPPRFPPRAYTNPRTGEVTVHETGIGPGFSFNVGREYLRGATPTLMSGSAEVDVTSASAKGEGVEAFLAAFDATDEDRVWFDGDGYPQIIGPSLFLDAAGRRVPLTTTQLGDLARVARTLREPDRISWVWVRRGDAPALLMRRYRRHGLVVDMVSGGASPAWRFQTVD